MTDENRVGYIVAGASGGALLVGLLTLTLPADSIVATVVLDRTSPIFPYPFTIQNLMTVFLGVGLGEIARLRQEVARQEAALSIDLLPEEGERVLTLDDLPLIRESLARVHPRNRGIATRLIESCAMHFAQSRSPTDVLSLLETQIRIEDQKVDLRYSLVRYLAWFLPTLGFIGTVVGIAAALSIAGEAASAGSMSDSMAGIVAALGVAFNTTILSLIYSAVLVFAQMHVQTRDESMIVTIGEYCVENLVRRLRAPTPKV